MSVAHVTIQVQGRIVMGHPIKRQPMMKDKKPLMNDDGTPKTQHFFVLAIPKGQETDWKQTDWGQKVVGVAMQGYRNGEINRPNFAWKVEDGDSQVPNLNNRKNADSEGHPGHWIIKCTTQLGCPCFPYGKYSPFDAISDIASVKCGDYYLVSIDCADNTNNGAPAQTPGVYMNPMGTVFIRAGVEIMSGGTVDGNELFGGVVIQGAEQPMQSAAPVVQQQATTPPPPPAQQTTVQPAHDMVQPGNAAPPPPPPAEPSYEVGGKVYTKSALLASNYTEAHFANMTPVA